VITTWRITKARYADEVFSGEGARLTRGRWHREGHRVVYTSETISLATLELIVNSPPAQLLADYVVTSCTFPEVLVKEVDVTQLPANWREYPPPAELQKIGVEWLLSLSSAVLAVPSAVTPEEHHYLINPEHEHFRSVDVGQSRPFQLDLRLRT
jgi:RES domain-containing protein